jgi:hypothetical protein
VARHHAIGVSIGSTAGASMHRSNRVFPFFLPKSSCVLFDLFIDDLVQAVDAACAGVPLPVPDDSRAVQRL